MTDENDSGLDRLDRGFARFEDRLNRFAEDHEPSYSGGAFMVVFFAAAVALAIVKALF